MKQAKEQMATKPKLKKLYIYATENNNRYLLEFREFDEQGKIITEIAFYQDGSVYEKVVHTYIGDKVIQSNYFSENEKASHTVSFSYDDDEHITKESTWYADGSLTIKTIERNMAELSEVITTRDEEDTIEGKTFHQFNKEGKPILEIIYDESGEDEVERTTFSYDEAGLPIHIEGTSKDGTKPFIRNIEYVEDENGNIIDTITRNEKGIVMGTEKRDYDENGNVIGLEEVNNYTGQYRDMEWEFDEKGNNVAIRQYNRRGDMNVEILLENDEHDRIILEETRIAGQGVTLKEYVYEFYES